VNHSVGAGWIFLDVLRGLSSLIVDAATGSWNQPENTALRCSLEQSEVEVPVPARALRRGASASTRCVAPEPPLRCERGVRFFGPSLAMDILRPLRGRGACGRIAECPGRLLGQGDAPLSSTTLQPASALALLPSGVVCRPRTSPFPGDRNPGATAMQTLTSFLTALIALSVGVERIVEVLKGFVSWLRKDPDPTMDPGGRRAARRRAILQILAALIGTGTVFAIGPETFLSTLPLAGPWQRWAAAVLLGVMASGGSAFWNHALDVLDAVKKTREGLVVAQANEEAARQLSRLKFLGAPIGPNTPPESAVVASLARSVTIPIGP
jgi:hypothetical protein